MSSFQKRISERVAAIPPPQVLLTNNLQVPPAGIFDSDTLTSAGIALRTTVSPDLLPTLLKFKTPSIFEGRSVQSDIPPVLSFDLGISARYVEAESFPLTAQQYAYGSSVDSPSLSDDLFESLLPVKVMGMNYRDRIWRELRQLDFVDPSPKKRYATKPLSKSYIEPEQMHKRKADVKPPSFWDLMFVVLQPPLILEQIDNLYLPADLYPYQPAGIEFLMHNESALLADEMGTGKTVMTAVALRILMQKGQARQALVVCPLSVLRQWNRELDKWAPDLLVTVVRGDWRIRTTDWEMPAHVYLTTYDTLRSDIEKGILPDSELGRFDVVVLDEAQYIKNTTSSRSRAIKQLRARRRWVLTGTPVENKIEDVASLFEFLRPGYLTPFDLYPDRIREKIAPYFLRRRKEDVLPDLPPKIIQDVWLELDSDQRATYDWVSKQVRDELTALGSHVTKMDIMQRIQRLKQICNFAPGKFTSPKIDRLKEQVEEIADNNRKVIVFSQYLREGIDKMEQSLAPYGTAKIVGEQSEPIRNSALERFKTSDKIPILLASLKAGGVGLNLTEANYVIHFDHWWNPAVMWQAEARVHRPGQTGKDEKKVFIYSYWMVDTIEERIYRMLKEKGLLFENVVDALSESQIEELVSTEEWLDMLGVKAKVEAKPEPRRQIFADLGLEEIREKLYEISPSAFENLAKELLHSLGYPQVKVTGRSHDGGIDVIATRNTPDGVLRAVVQCKRYKGTVGVEVARALRGVIATNKDIHKGFLVTSGDFSRECQRFCEMEGVIVPIYGLQVARYIKQFGLAV